MASTVSMSPSLYSMMMFVEERGGRWAVIRGTVSTEIQFQIGEFKKSVTAHGDIPIGSDFSDKFEKTVFEILSAYRDSFPRPNECPTCWRQMKRIELFTSVHVYCEECAIDESQDDQNPIARPWL